MRVSACIVGCFPSLAYVCACVSVHVCGLRVHAACVGVCVCSVGPWNVWQRVLYVTCMGRSEPHCVSACVCFGTRASTCRGGRVGVRPRARVSACVCACMCACMCVCVYFLKICDEHVEQEELSFIVGWERKLYSHFGRHLGSFLQNQTYS